MNFQLIHIEQLKPQDYPAIFKPQKSPEYKYIGIAIEDDGLHYYWAKGVSLKNYQMGVSAHQSQSKALLFFYCAEVAFSD